MKQEKVILICCGRNHTLLATESGYIYSFGCNSESQLGLNRSDSFYNTPQKISSIPSLNWKILSAGAGQSCALSEDGSLYVWGINDNGELGLGSVPEQSIPKKIDLNFKVKFVSCGYYHTAIISKTGKLFTAGSNEYYQLGRDGKEKKFNEVEGVDAYVKYVSCGGGHTLFSTEGSVFFSFSFFHLKIK
jgi:X-linked retinitis pigmentosa GTPase regulator